MESIVPWNRLCRGIDCAMYWDNICTTLKKTRNLKKKKTTRHISQRSVFNPGHSAFLKIPQNIKYITNYQKRLHKPHFEGGHFNSEFAIRELPKIFRALEGNRV